MKKKLIAIALSVSVLATLAVGITLAYFTDTETKTNTFTVGNVGILLTEPAWDGPNGTGKLDAAEVYPGEPLAKDPTVTNNGANPCLVRIQIVWPANIAMEYRTGYATGVLGDDWVVGGDGYFYYLKPLATGEHTSALFDQIVVPTSLINGDAGVEFNVVVKAYAVQAQGVFPSYSNVADGIDQTTELPAVQNFFTTAFAA